MGDEARRFVEHLRKHERCHWCGRDTTKKSKLGFCGPCNRVRLHLRKLEKLNADPKRRTFPLDFELRVTRQMVKDCKASGMLLHHVLVGPTDALKLEHDLDRLAKRIARDDRMFSGMATQLGWMFDADQRQALAYFFWKMFATESSLYRKQRASGRVATGKETMDDS